MKWAILLIMVFLAGCDNDPNIEDLKSYIETIKADQKEKELPKIDVEHNVDFKVDEHIDPFNNTLSAKTKNFASQSPLTTMPIESMAVVGTVNEGEQLWAFLEIPNGSVFKIKKGSLVGLNHGQVTEINGHQIEVTERVFNKVGDLLQRTVTITTQRQAQ